MSARWCAFLSDGQVVNQTDLADLNEPKSEWLMLLDYLYKHPEITIRSLQLVVNGVVYNTPSLTANDGAPCNLWCYQKMGAVIMGGHERTYYISLIYKVGDFYHYLWVNKLNNELSTEVCSALNEREQIIEEFYKTRTIK